MEASTALIATVSASTFTVSATVATSILISSLAGVSTRSLIPVFVTTAKPFICATTEYVPGGT